MDPGRPDASLDFVREIGRATSLAEILDVLAAHGQVFTDSEHHAALVRSLTAIATDQVELQRQVDEAQQLALVDPLTGAANRRAFSARGNEQLSSWHEVRRPFALGILDLDHFKELNDHYGHSAGDVVLKLVVDTLNAQSRSEDVVARVGGEEFALTVAHANRDQATAMFERIRETIEGLTITVDGTDLKITASIGVTTAGPYDVDVDHLFARADAALYEAKRAGRNQVVFRGPEPT